MPWGSGSLLFRRVGLALLAGILSQPTFAQTNAEPEKLLEQAERLAWLKAWTRAAPLYAEAERLYAARGDRNALYASKNSKRRRLRHIEMAASEMVSSGHFEGVDAD